MPEKYFDDFISESEKQEARNDSSHDLDGPN